MIMDEAMTAQGRDRLLAAAAVCVPAALYLAWAVSYFARFGYPLPEVHDEFSYLLAADTFARGRLANPSPAFPEFFETIHELVEPSYASMYPPAQGVWLAAGQVAAGHPWWGVVLSTALFVAAAGWAALAWVKPGWAMGAGMAALSYTLGTYWSTSYWGGSAAALGGALVLGSLGRLRLRWTGMAERDGAQGAALPGLAGMAALWALGSVMAVLARPYEGGVLALLSAIELGRQVLRSPLVRKQKRAELLGLAGGAALPACAGALFLMAVNQAATGSPWRLAYLEHARQYQIRRTFYWQQDRPAPVYRHEAIRAVYDGLLRREMSQCDKLAENWRMYRDHYGSLKFNAAGLAAALAWGGGAGLGWVTGMVFAGFAAAWMIVWTHPHYYAPFAAFLAAAVAGGWAQAARRSWFGRRRTGWIIVLFVSLLAPRFVLLLGRRQEQAPFALRRAEILRQLESAAGRHLILVKYRPGRALREEWVYNGADLENAKVLWARWHESPRLPAFLAHHAGRTFWILEADMPGAPLSPYESRTAGRR